MNRANYLIKYTYIYFKQIFNLNTYVMYIEIVAVRLVYPWINSAKIEAVYFQLHFQAYSYRSQYLKVSSVVVFPPRKQ